MILLLILKGVVVMSEISKNFLIVSFLATYPNPTTKKTVSNVVNLFLDYLGNSIPKAKLSDIDDLIIMQFISYKANDILFSTANQYLATIKVFIKFLHKRKVISADAYNLISDIKPIRGSRPPAGRALKKREIEKIKKVYNATHRMINIRDFAIFSIAAYAGARRAELSKLDIASIDSNKLTIIGKGNKYRTVYLSPFAIKAIKRWLAESEIKKGALFRAVDRWGNTKSERLGVDGIGKAVARIKDYMEAQHFTTHDLRRTFATSLLDNNADIFTVQSLMGHASIDTTKIYDRRSERIKKQTIKLLPY